MQDDMVRVKRLLDRQGWSWADFARRVSREEAPVTDQHVNNWKKRGLPKSQLKRVAEVMGTTVDWLMTGMGPMSPTTEVEPNTEPAPGPQGALVPVISWVHAGTPTAVFDPYEPGHAEEWVAPTFKPGPHVYGLRVVGVSMTPRFQPGQILIVDPDQAWHSGSFVILKNGDGEAVFRQIVKETGEWMMVALNPDYKPKPLGDYQVIGVVRQAIDLIC